MKKIVFIVCFAVLIAHAACAIQLNVHFSTNIFYYGERTAFTVTATSISNVIATNYTGFVRLSCDCALVRIMGKNPDNSDVALPNSGDVILLKGRSGPVLYLYSSLSGTFTLTVSENIQNSSNSASSGTMSFTVLPDSGILKFSEIMSDVIDTNYQYVEIFNNSRAPVDLSNLSIYQYKTGNTYNTTSKKLVVQNTGHFPLPPGGYFPATMNKSRLKEIFAGINSLPGPAANVFVKKLDFSSHLTMYLNGVLCDACYYSSSATPQNCSLERVSFSVDSFNADNWVPSLTRARSDLDFFGTPGTQNGAFIPQGKAAVNLNLFPNNKIFDRSAGTCTLSFSSDLPGRVSLLILNSNGIIVRRLISETDIPSAQTQNAGFDGRDNQGHPLPTGCYFALLRYINDSKGQFKEKASSLIISK